MDRWSRIAPDSHMACYWMRQYEVKVSLAGLKGQNQQNVILRFREQLPFEDIIKTMFFLEVSFLASSETFSLMNARLHRGLPAWKPWDRE